MEDTGRSIQEGEESRTASRKMCPLQSSRSAWGTSVDKQSRCTSVREDSILETCAEDRFSHETFYCIHGRKCMEL